MSARHHYAKEAEELEYGFLAARAKEVIAKSLNAEDRTDDDQEVLARAAEFLIDISRGARLVNTKETHGHRSSESLHALTLALDPLDTLQRLVNDEGRDVAEFFSDLAEVLTEVAKSKAPVTEPQAEKLNLTERLFAAIYQSLRASLSENRRLRGNLGQRYQMS